MNSELIGLGQNHSLDVFVLREGFEFLRKAEIGNCVILRDVLGPLFMGQFMGCCGVEKFVFLQAAPGNSRNYPSFSIFLFRVRSVVIRKPRNSDHTLRILKKLEEFHKYREEKAHFVFSFLLLIPPAEIIIGLN